MIYPYKIYDTANRFNYAKTSIINYNEGEADFGTFTNFGGSTVVTTDGFGLLTIVSRTLPEGSSAFYSVPISSNYIDKKIIVEVNITVSGITSGILYFESFFETSTTTYTTGNRLDSLASNGNFTFVFESVITVAQNLRVGVLYNSDLSLPTTAQFTSVKIYEEGKEVILTPANGKLYNKTIENLGVLNPSLQTEFKDIYKGNILQKNGLNTKGLTTLNVASGFGDIIGTGDMSLVLHFDKATGGILRTFLLNGGYIPILAYIEVFSNTIVRIIGSNLNRLITSTDVGITGIDYIQKKLEITVLLRYTNSNTLTSSIYIHNQNKWYDFVDTLAYDFTGKPSMNLFHLSNSDTIVYRQAILSRDITKDEALDLDSVLIGDKIEDIIYNEDQGTKLISTSTEYTLNTLADFNEKVGGSWLEKKSLLPPISQGLFQTGTSKRVTIPSTTPFNPPNDGGVTFQHIFNLDSNRDFNSDYLFSTRGAPDTNSLFYYGATTPRLINPTFSNLQADISPQTTSTILNVILVFEDGDTLQFGKIYVNGVLLGEATTTLANKKDFTTNNVDTNFWYDVVGNLTGNLIACNIWNRPLAKVEAIEFSNQLLINTESTFSRSLPQKNLIFSNQYQEGSFYSGTTEPMVRNLAPASNFPVGSATVPSDWDGECLGWGGGTAADKLIDLRSNIIDLKFIK